MSIRLFFFDYNNKYNKKLSCRKETVRLLRGSVLAKCNWNTIFCGYLQRNKNLFVRNIVFIRRFYRCSQRVKWYY